MGVVYVVFCYVGTKTFTYSHKNYDIWPKNGQIWSKICIFGHFGPNIAIFSHFVQFLTKTLYEQGARGFSVMWVTKLLISPVKIRIFCPKKSKFGPKMAFLFFLGQALPAHLVGGCGARAVSRKTPILYFIDFMTSCCRLRRGWWRSPSQPGRPFSSLK